MPYVWLLASYNFFIAGMAIGAFLIVPVSILFVIRHTRSEEEAGRRELLGGIAQGVLRMLVHLDHQSVCSCRNCGL